MEIRALLAVLFASALLLAGTTPATAAIPSSSFPRTSFVKSTMKGKGTWERYVSAVNPPANKEAGVLPKRCDWDPMSGSQETRTASHFGPLKGQTGVWGSTSVQVVRFASAARAQAALAKAKKYVRECGKIKVWVCADCDGVWDATLTLKGSRKVGQSSVAWSERRVGMGVTTLRMIAARSGRTVVVTTVAHDGDPVSMRTPKFPTWNQADKLATKALRTAT